MIIVFVGAPGSGKGTQAELFIKDGWVQLSTGDMFRKIIKEDTPFAKEVKAILASGKLVSDEITSKIVKLSIAEEVKKGSNIILDGYPRTTVQVEHLNKMLSELNTKIDSVINFEIEEKLLLNRLSNRRVCPTCKKTYHLINMPPKNEGVCDLDNEALIQREDDFEDKIKIRLETYHKLTAPIINVLKDLIVNVDGSKNPKDIYQSVKESINK